MSDEVRPEDEATTPEEAASAEPYVENPDFRPDPTAMTGTLDTSGTSGQSETAESVSPVFDVADAQNLGAAAAANPENEQVAAAAERAAERLEDKGYPQPDASPLAPEGTANLTPRDPGAVVETDDDGNVVADEETGQPVERDPETGEVVERADEPIVVDESNNGVDDGAYVGETDEERAAREERERNEADNQ